MKFCDFKQFMEAEEDKKRRSCHEENDRSNKRDFQAEYIVAINWKNNVGVAICFN